MKGKRVLLFFCCVFLTASEAAIGIFNITSAGGQRDQPWPRTVGGADGGGRKRFEIITSTTLSWGDALLYCKERRTDLATIRSQEENDALVNLMTQAGLIKDNVAVAFWIGGTSTNSPKGFYWVNDGETIYNYVNWHKGEPSSENEHCLMYFYSQATYKGSTNVKWNDSTCDFRAYIVCEYYS